MSSVQSPGHNARAFQTEHTNSVELQVFSFNVLAQAELALTALLKANYAPHSANVIPLWL